MRPAPHSCARWHEQFRPLAGPELTYTSNAIEGNTLTAIETTMVIEQGITVAGKLRRIGIYVISEPPT